MALAVNKHLSSDKNECEWTYTDPFDYDYWETGCGEAFCFDDNELKENNYFYCPNCGKKIKEIMKDG